MYNAHWKKEADMADGLTGQRGTHLIGDQIIIPGDCLEALVSRIEAASVDVIVTSPPYNLNVRYSLYDDAKTETDYLVWLLTVADGIKRVLKHDGSFFLNISGSSSKPWIPFEIIVELRKAGFSLQNHITWIKSITVEAESSGHFKPVSGKRFLHHNHEHIFHLTLDNDVQLDRLSIGTPFQDKTNIARRGHARDLRCRGNTWFIPYPTVRTKAQKFWHPGTFPVELPLWCIYLHGKPDAVVLDPFMGTGTTLVAAHFAGARGIGVDLDPAYITTACQRITEAVETSLLLSLNREEIVEIFRQDETDGGGNGWQARLISFQQRLNKTTGQLALMEDDVAWIRKFGSRPEDGSWQRWLNTAFRQHIDLGGQPQKPLLRVSQAAQTSLPFVGMHDF
jgi:site-specific DNA-methyltransferase (adenine-specific)